MSADPSFYAVLAFWLAISLAAWAWHTRRLRATGRRGGEAIARASALVTQAVPRLAAIRSGGLPPMLYVAADADHARLRADTLALLRRLDEARPYFEAISGQRRELMRRLGLSEIAGLDEVLHVRRDIWAAADILLMEEYRHLGVFATDAEYRALAGDAARLVFQTPHAGPGDDPIIQRLTLAEGAMTRLAIAWEADSAAAIEHDRLPRPAEVAAALRNAVAGLPGRLAAARAETRRFGEAVRQQAAAIRATTGATRGIAALLALRESVPAVRLRIDRAARRAAASAPALARHYHVVAATHALSHAYEAALRSAPALSEAGRGWLARAEELRAAERMRLASETARARVQSALIWTLAHLIARLQGWQERLAPPPTLPLPQPPADSTAPALASLDEVRTMLQRALTRPVPAEAAQPCDAPAAPPPEEVAAAQDLARRFAPATAAPEAMASVAPATAASPPDAQAAPRAGTQTARPSLHARLAALDAAAEAAAAGEPQRGAATPASPTNAAPAAPRQDWLRLFRSR